MPSRFGEWAGLKSGSEEFGDDRNSTLQPGLEVETMEVEAMEMGGVLQFIVEIEFLLFE